LSFSQALELGIPIDPKRSTRYDENVTALKGYLDVETTPLTSAVDLREVKGIGQKRAEQLKAAGFDSVQKLANGEPQHVAEAVSVSENRAANWIENAKLLLSS
jgi:predicted flap endonuclease-1-like 5' DNA nuclease